MAIKWKQSRRKFGKRNTFSVCQGEKVEYVQKGDNMEMKLKK